jgi:hypothetical protein
MKRMGKAVLWFLYWCGIMILAAVVYIALTVFPPRSRF